MNARVANQRWIAAALAALAAIAFAALLLLGASLGGDPASASAGGSARAGSAKVAIRNFKFRPGTLTVSAGTRVVFANKDDVKHTATDRGVFNTHRIKPGTSKSISFDTPGTFKYVCLLHPDMHGKVVVNR